MKNVNIIENDNTATYLKLGNKVTDNDHPLIKVKHLVTNLMGITTTGKESFLI